MSGRRCSVECVHLGYVVIETEEVQRLATIRPRRHRHAPRRLCRQTPCGSASTTTSVGSCCNVAPPRTSPRSAGSWTTTRRSTRSSLGSGSTACPSSKAPTRKRLCAAWSGWSDSPDPTASPRRSSRAHGPAPRRCRWRRAVDSSPAQRVWAMSLSPRHEAPSGARVLQHRVRRATVRLHRRDDQRRQVQDPVPAGQRAPSLRGDRCGQPHAAEPDPHPGAAPQHPGRRPRRHDGRLPTGQGTRLPDGAGRRPAHQRQGAVLLRRHAVGIRMGSSAGIRSWSTRPPGSPPPIGASASGATPGGADDHRQAHPVQDRSRLVATRRGRSPRAGRLRAFQIIDRQHPKGASNDATDRHPPPRDPVLLPRLVA